MTWEKYATFEALPSSLEASVSIQITDHIIKNLVIYYGKYVCKNIMEDILIGKY